MTEITLTSDQVINLLKHARQVGRQDKAIDLAIYWIEFAGKELDRLAKLVTEGDYE